MEHDMWQVKVRQLERRRWVVWVPLALAFLAAYFHRTATGGRRQPDARFRDRAGG